MQIDTLTFFKLYVLATPVFFLIDMIWLGFVARGFYAAQLGSLLGDVRWPVAILFYLLFIIGIVLFAVGPAVSQQSLQTALLYGAAFGFFTYSTYDLTNLATLKDWPVIVAVVDIIWGTVLSASVAGVTYWLSQLIYGNMG